MKPSQPHISSGWEQFSSREVTQASNFLPFCGAPTVNTCDIRGHILVRGSSVIHLTTTPGNSNLWMMELQVQEALNLSYSFQ